MMRLYNRLSCPLYSVAWGRIVLVMGGIILFIAIVGEDGKNFPTIAEVNALFAAKIKWILIGGGIFAFGLAIQFLRDPNGFIEKWNKIFH